MTNTRSGPKYGLPRHWFLPLAVAIVVGDLSSVYVAGWADPQILEAALLFDFVVLIPVLYWWCYRSKGTVAVVHAIALACFALWATGMVIPTEHRNLLDSVAWLRYVGLAGLLALQIKLAVTIYKAVLFSGQSRSAAQKKFQSEGMPPWLAKFMAFEAALWRKAWLFLQRVFGGKSR